MILTRCCNSNTSATASAVWRARNSGLLKITLSFMPIWRSPAADCLSFARPSRVSGRSGVFDHAAFAKFGGDAVAHQVKFDHVDCPLSSWIAQQVDYKQAVTDAEPKA